MPTSNGITYLKVQNTSASKALPKWQISHQQSGFSLLELLLVVALIGILATYAVPTYQGYMERTRFMEVVQQTQAVRVSQTACIMRAGNDLGQCDSFSEMGMAAPTGSDNTASVSVASSTAVITGTGTAAAGDHTYVLTPSFTDSKLGYAVTGTCADAGVC